MECRLSSLCDKEIVNMKDGAILGRIGDLVLETATAHICAMVVLGRLKWFGLLGREDDIIVPWDKIEIIGADAILVCIEPTYTRKKRRRFLDLIRSKR